MERQEEEERREINHLRIVSLWGEQERIKVGGNEVDV